MNNGVKWHDGVQWQAAAQAEIDAHLANGTWTPCPLPAGKKAILCRWVFAKKYNADGTVERLKARLVTKGFTQRPGFDYVETFAPTVRMASICTVLALATLEDLDLRSVDISHAYINGTLEEEIYMQQPDGFHFGKPGDVLRFVKFLYGLKQAGRVWFLELSHVLKEEGFTCLKSDASFFLWRKDDIRIVMPVFTDDITIASPSTASADQVVAKLSEHFKLRDLGWHASTLTLRRYTGLLLSICSDI
jgi:hypothetical protein